MPLPFLSEELGISHLQNSVYQHTPVPWPTMKRYIGKETWIDKYLPKTIVEKPNGPFFTKSMFNGSCAPDCAGELVISFSSTKKSESVN